MKRFLSLALIAALLLACAPASLAAKKQKKQEAVEEPPASAIVPAYQMVEGTIQSVDTKNSSIEISKSDGSGSLVLLMGNPARIVDNVKRNKVKLHALKVGSAVRAWHENVAAAGNPPRVTGLAMLANILPGQAEGMYFEVEWVGKVGGNYTLLNQPQNLYLHVSSGIKMPVFGSGNSVKIDAMIPGARFIYWPDEKAATEETLAGIAQATAANIVMFAYDYDGYFIMEKSYINVNGYMQEAQAITDETTGAILVPAVEAAQRMGYRTTYNKANQSLTLKSGNGTATVFTAGESSFTTGKKQQDTVAPKLVDGILYVALDALISLAKYKVVIRD